jgi:hypothetical protein
MDLPDPQRARTAAGILFAVCILLFAGDVAIVKMAAADATVIPFTAFADNATAVGMRITNADQGDTIQAFQAIATAACGYVYRPILLAGESIDDLRNMTPEEVDQRVRDSQTPVTGNVTFYVLESVHTPDLLRGEDVPTYLATPRSFDDAPISRVFDQASASPTPTSAPDDGSVIVHRAVYQTILAECFRVGGLDIDRTDDPGTRTIYALSSSEPWVALLPTAQGVDFVYVVRNEDNDNETFALVQDSLIRSIPLWTQRMEQASVFDQQAKTPELVLRISFAATFTAALVLLGLSLRAAQQTAAPTSTDAAFAVAWAGEGHLVNLRNALCLVGALLVPVLGGATYLAWTMHAPPWAAWNQQVLVAVHLLDLAVVALWALTLRRVHRDLVAWRQAWTRLHGTTLDDL